MVIPAASSRAQVWLDRSAVCFAVVSESTTAGGVSQVAPATVATFGSAHHNWHHNRQRVAPNRSVRDTLHSMSVYFYYALVILLGVLFILVLVEAFRSLGEVDTDTPRGDSGSDSD